MASRHVSKAIVRAASAVVEGLERRQLFDVAPTQIGINFGPWASEADPGYITDAGEAYGTRQSGYDFGWDTAISSSNTFERFPGKSQRYETGVVTSVGNKWEISIPNGTYVVRLAAGDANVTSGTYKYNVEGVTNFINASAGSGDARWVAVANNNVVVSDGKLTISDGGGTQHRLAFVDIALKSAKDRSTVAAPTNVSVTARLQDQIDIRWIDNADNEDFDDGYVVERTNVATSAVSTWNQAGGIRQFLPDWQNLTANTTYSYRLRTKRTNTSGQVIYSSWTSPVSITTPANNNQAAYGGTNANIAGTIEAENYDKGAGSDAYLDNLGGNAGGFYRAGSVDVGLHMPTNTYYVGWVETGEWQEYTSNIATSGNYYVVANVASPGQGGVWKINVGGVDKLTGIQVKDTGGFHVFQSQSTGTFSLTSGNNQVFRFEATAEDASGKFVGNFSSFTFQRFDAPTVNAPTTPSSSQVNLTWTNRHTGAGWNAVYRRVPGAPTWTQIATIAGTATTYADTDPALTPGSTYEYMLRGQREMLGTTPTTYDYTADSNTVSATLPGSVQPPDAPSNLQAAMSGASVTLTWVDNSNNETGFVLQRSESNTFPVGATDSFSPDVNAISYLDTTANANKTYYYQLKAVNSSGPSAWVQTSITTPATTTANFVASEDTYVRDGTHANSAYGTESDLWLKTASWQDVHREGYLKFNLSSLSGSVTEAKLWLYGKRNDYRDANFSFDVRKVASSDWSETEMTYASRPAMTDLEATITIASDTAFHWYEVDLTQYVQEELAVGHSTISLGLLGAVATDDMWQVKSSEATNTTERPYLRITTGVTSTPPAAAPSELHRVVPDPDVAPVGIGWTDNSNNEAGFEVDRKVGAGAWSTITTSVAANGISYTDTTYDPGSDQWYRVRAVNAAGPSSDSNELIIPARPAAPSANPITANSVTLTWTDVSSVETGYHVERLNSTGQWVRLTTTPLQASAGSVTYVDPTVTPFNTYTYRVRAVSSTSEGIPSVAVIVTVSGSQPIVSFPNMPSELRLGSTFAYQPVIEWDGDVALLSSAWNISLNGEPFWEGSDEPVSFNAYAPGEYVLTYETWLRDGTPHPARSNGMWKMIVQDQADNYALAGDSVVVAGKPAYFELHHFSAGAGLLESISIDWGDGSPSESFPPSTRQFTHIFNYPSYSGITLTLQAHGVTRHCGKDVSFFPDKPASLAVARQSITSAQLTWYHMPGATSYSIALSTDGLHYSTCGGVAAVLDNPVQSYAVTRLDPAERYFFRVASYSGNGSALLEASVPLEPLEIERPPAWDASSTDTTFGVSLPTNYYASSSYFWVLEWREGNEPNFKAVANANKGDSIIAIGGLKPDTLYEYRLRAVSEDGWQSISDSQLIYTKQVQTQSEVPDGPWISATSSNSMSVTCSVETGNEFDWWEIVIVSTLQGRWRSDTQRVMRSPHIGGQTSIELAIFDDGITLPASSYLVFARTIRDGVASDVSLPKVLALNPEHTFGTEFPVAATWQGDGSLLVSWHDGLNLPTDLTLYFGELEADGRYTDTGRYDVIGWRPEVSFEVPEGDSYLIPASEFSATAGHSTTRFTIQVREQIGMPAVLRYFGSIPVSRMSLPAAPTAPDAFLVQYRLSGPSIFWGNPVSTEDTFLIQRSENEEEFATIATVRADALSYRDASRDYGKRYWYRIGVKVGSSIAWSAVMEAPPIPLLSAANGNVAQLGVLDVLHQIADTSQMDSAFNGRLAGWNFTELQQYALYFGLQVAFLDQEIRNLDEKVGFLANQVANLEAQAEIEIDPAVRDRYERRASDANERLDAALGSRIMAIKARSDTVALFDAMQLANVRILRGEAGRPPIDAVGIDQMAYASLNVLNGTYGHPIYSTFDEVNAIALSSTVLKWVGILGRLSATNGVLAELAAARTVTVAEGYIRVGTPGAIPVQSTNYSCASVCISEVLAERGIVVTERELIEHAAMLNLHEGLTADAVEKMMTSYSGLKATTDLGSLTKLGTKLEQADGSFIVVVSSPTPNEGHAMVGKLLDSSKVYLRDPYTGLGAVKNISEISNDVLFFHYFPKQ